MRMHFNQANEKKQSKSPMQWVDSETSLEMTKIITNYCLCSLLQGIAPLYLFVWGL